MHTRDDRDVMSEVARIGEEQMNRGDRVLLGQEIGHGNIRLEPDSKTLRVRHLRPSSLVRCMKTAIFVCDEDMPTWGMRDFYYYVEYITPQEYVGYHLNQ